MWCLMFGCACFEALLIHMLRMADVNPLRRGYRWEYLHFYPAGCSLLFISLWQTDMTESHKQSVVSPWSLTPELFFNCWKARRIHTHTHIYCKSPQLVVIPPSHCLSISLKSQCLCESEMLTAWQTNSRKRVGEGQAIHWAELTVFEAHTPSLFSWNLLSIWD